MWLTFYTFILCLNAINLSHSQSDYGEIKFFDAPTSYTAESTVLLNDINKRDKEISFKISSTLNVYPVWKDNDTEYFFKFELLSPQLLGRGTHVNAEYMPLASMWDSYSSTQFYAHWKNGIVNELYIDPSEPEEVLNYKRSLVSLFQFNSSNDLGNETDISGTCEVQYEMLSEQVIRKIKRRCSWGGAAAGEVTSRRVTRYSLDEARAPRELYAEEVHELAAALGDAALKARAWLRLRRAPARPAPPAPAPAPAPAAASLLAALQLLPPALAPLPLAMAAPIEHVDHPPTATELEALIEESMEALGGSAASEDESAASEDESTATDDESAEGESGPARAVSAALRLLSALRAAPPPALADLLRARAGDLAALGGALGLTGSVAALGAARDLLLAEPALAHRFFEGFALAVEPEEAAVMEVLRIGEESPHADVAESALLAAAAVASRLPPAPAPAPAPAAHVRERLLQALASCQEDECRAVRLRALGNLRCGGAADALLEHAGRGGSAARAALDALGALPERALLNATRLRRLERAVLAWGPLELRAAALELLLRRTSRAPATLLPLLEALPRALRRVAWHVLEALAPAHEPVRELLATLPLQLRGWDERAARGAPALLLRRAGGGGGWRADLSAALLESGGELRRAALTLAVLAPDDLVDETIAVELRARAVRPLADRAPGADDEPQAERSAAGAELGLRVGGVRARPRPLFADQAELPAAADEPASVLRVLRPLVGARVALPLLGAGVLRLERRGALALALDAAGRLEAEGGRARLWLRGALAAEAEARVAGAWGELSARSRLWAAPRLRVWAGRAGRAGRAVCARASVGRWERAVRVELRSALGAARRRVRRERGARWPAPGRSLALGAGAACGSLE